MRRVNRAYRVSAVPFTVMLIAGFASVPPAQAKESGVRVNEVVTNGDAVADWVELVNTTASDIDISGWTAVDEGKSSVPIKFKKGTVIPAGGYYAFYTESGYTPDGSKGFGLGGKESITIKDAAGEVVDSKAWSSHAQPNGTNTSWGLVPDGTGDWKMTSGATRGFANAQAKDFQNIVINEVTADGIDYVELANKGTADVNIGGWRIVDSLNGTGNTYIEFPMNTFVRAGGYFVFTPDGKEGGKVPDGSDGFGLGSKDSLKLTTAAGEQVDEISWGEAPVCNGNATSWSRFPDMNGDLAVAVEKTRGAANAKPCAEDNPGTGATTQPSTSAAPAPGKIVINEVMSNGDPVADWVELYNVGGTAVDISGWKFLDNNDGHTPIVFKKGTVIQPGEFFTFYTDGKANTPDGSAGVGLGEPDSARLFDKNGQLVDRADWTGHKRFTLGRYPDGTGDFAPLRGVSRNAPNLPAYKADEPWPYDKATEALSIKEQHLPGFDVENFSGIDFDSEGNAWVVKNKPSQLWKLSYDEEKDEYSISQDWDLHYADGSGAPDAEGVTVGKDGNIYIATERDGSGTSRPSVLKFDINKQRVTQEWNLREYTGAVSDNGGLEAIAYLADLDVYAVGVEDTGEVLFVRLDDNGTSSLVTRYANDMLLAVMALDYDADNKELRVLCDEACGGLSVLVKYDGTSVTPVSGIQDRPKNMPDLANEGYGMYRKVGECNVSGQQVVVTRFLWADDAATGTPALRSGISKDSQPCTPSTTSVATTTQGTTTATATATTVVVPATTVTTTPTTTVTDPAKTLTITTTPTTFTTTPTVATTQTTVPTSTAAAKTVVATETAKAVTTTPTVTTTQTTVPTTTAAAKTEVATETAKAVTTTPTVTTTQTTVPTTTAAAKTEVATETAQAVTTTPTVTKKVTTVPTATADASTVTETATAKTVTVVPTVTETATTIPTHTAAPVTVTETMTALPVTKTAEPVTETATVTEKVTTTPTVTEKVTTTPTVTEMVTTTPTHTAAPVTITEIKTAQPVTQTAKPVTETAAGGTETVTTTPTLTTVGKPVTETATAPAVINTVTPKSTTERVAPALTGIVAGETRVIYRVPAAEGAVIEVKDLPAGLQFDAEKHLIAGKVEKPGVYEATIVTTLDGATTVEQLKIVAAPSTGSNNAAPGATTTVTTAASPATVTSVTTVPQAAGSSLDGKCVAAIAGWLIPLAALVPLGLATQIELPLPPELTEAIRPLQEQAAQLLPQVDPQVQMAAGGLAAAALGIVAIASILNACTGGEGSSVGSSK